MSSKVSEVTEDFLDTDPAIRGQEFCCLSFVSPERVLEKKETYFFSEFMKFYEAKIRFDTLEKFLAENANRHNDKIEEARMVLTDTFSKIDLSGLSPETKSLIHNLSEDLDQKVANTRVNIQDTFDAFKEHVSLNKEILVSKKNIKSAYDDFIYTKGEELEHDFHKENDFKTSVRGLKVRGVYSTHREACARAQKLQKQDPIHNVFVGQVGYWLPWDPEPSRVGEQEYAEKELNELMRKYKENDEKRKEIFENEKDSRVQAARDEAKKNNVTTLPGDGADAPASAFVAPAASASASAAAAASASASASDAAAATMSTSLDFSMPSVGAPVDAGIKDIAEARDIMAEMEANRIPINPSKVTEVMKDKDTKTN